MSGLTNISAAAETDAFFRGEKLNLSFGDKRILVDFDMELTAPVTVFMGPSGCGKTTLLRVMAGLQPVESGAIHRGFSRPAWVFQQDRLFPVTVLGNLLAVMAKKDEETARALLRAAGMEDEAGVYMEELSGGMRRRVALLRALAYKGDILLLDEPFSGMDDALTARLAPLILAQGVPVVMNTHDAAQAALLGARVMRFAGPPLSSE